MNWTLFWTAFGAIGTTIGSLITAIAVVVAVKQYKEPLVKRLNISFHFAFPIGMNHDIDLFSIAVSNTGIRPINISNIYLSVAKKNIVLNSAQFQIPGTLSFLNFPIELQPEQKIDMLIIRERLVGFFADALAAGTLKASSPVQILVTDQTGGEHYQKTGFTVKNFATNFFD